MIFKNKDNFPKKHRVLRVFDRFWINHIKRIGESNIFLSSISSPLTAIILALLLGMIPIIALGENPLLAYKELFLGAFGNLPGWLRTLRWSAPLIISGLAATIAFRAGVFNVGTEGSIWMGGIATAVVGIYLRGLPIFIHLPLALLAGIIAGGIWSLPAGIAKAKFKVNEIVFTLMANYIAALLATYLIRFPLQQQEIYFSFAETAPILSTAEMPWLNSRYELSATIILSIFLVLIVNILLKKSVWGYETDMVGKNQIFSGFGGVRNVKIVIVAMIISGAFAGLTGATEVVGNFHNIHERFSTGLGFDGINAALIGQFNPFGVLVSSIFLSGLKVGGQAIERNMALSRDIVNIIQALIILFITAQHLTSFLRFRRKKKE